MSAPEETTPPAASPEEAEAILDTLIAPAPEEEEAAPEAAAQKLSAFDRGKLRALGMGNLIARLETSEGQLAAALGEITSLKAENARLTAGRAAQEKAAHEALAAATTGREKEVSQGVREKLSALGVPETDAPASTSSAEGQTLSRAEFDQLDFAARNQFFRNSGKIVS